MVSSATYLHCQSLTNLETSRQYLDRIRTTAGPFAVEGFDGSVVSEAMDAMKIL